MNVFIFRPKEIATVGAAKYVLGLYQKEILAAQTTLRELDNQLAASLDVLIQTHPSLETDLRMLADQARLCGHADGVIQSTAQIRDDFYRALPYAVRKEMEAVS